jgi:site-specific DNA recombinase
MSEQSRLGREQFETGYVLKQIADAGVRVFFYADDREAVLDDPLQKMMLSLANFAAEMERDKARQRTHEAMLRKAKALHVTGGRVFGYDNIEVPGPDGKRLHVVRRVNEEQAAVVRRVFQMYAQGHGLVRIAKILNADGVPAPCTSGWAHTAIREMLRRELYAGVVVWNRTQKTVRAGSKKQRERQEREWLRLNAPELRIVSDDLWQAVRRRSDESAARLPRGMGGHYKARHGQAPQGDGLARFLLTGFARCAACGGALGGSTQLHGSGPASNRHRVSFYACTYNRKRGKHICANATTIKTKIVDQALLDALTELLQARVLDLAVDRAVKRLRAGREMHVDRRAEIERELSVIERRLGRLADAIANADAPVPTLVGKLKAEEYRKRSLALELESVQQEQAVASLNEDDVRERVHRRAADLRGVQQRDCSRPLLEVG